MNLMMIDNQLIAEKIMGWNVLSHWDANGTVKLIIDENQCEVHPAEFKPYLTDINTAWQVISRMQNMDFPRDSHMDRASSFEITTSNRNKLCEVTIRDSNYNIWVTVEAPTVPNAICFAAVEAVCGPSGLRKF